MAQLPQPTSPYRLTAACRFQNIPELERTNQGRKSCSGVSVSMWATLRGPVMLCHWGKATLTSLFIKTNGDVLVTNLQGAAA